MQRVTLNLITDVLYMAEDSKTRMKDARESILALAPANFKISCHCALSG